MAEQRRRWRRPVASRVLASFIVVTTAFALVAGWGVAAQRSAAREALLMRDAYLPLALASRDAVASQDVWNTQLNHITTAKNPADKRVWFEVALRGGRPRSFQQVRAALARAFASERQAGHTGFDGLSRDTGSIESFLQGDRLLVERLFAALEAHDERLAERLRAQLVTRGHEGKLRLSALEGRVQASLDAVIAQARQRERWAMRLMIGLALFTVLVGIAMAVYVSRVLRPLTLVTERAEAVAHGDLTPRPIPGSDDEIGDLARTFEDMVSAIARANQELLASERLATIGKMAAHVTHEIRNPLSSLALNVEMLEEELGEGDDEARGLLLAIKGEVERLTALSERYLSVARRTPARLEEEDLVEIARGAIGFVRAELEKKGVRVELHTAVEAAPVLADEGQLRQVLFNLLRNASEAMPKGGVITVRIEPDSGSLRMIVDDDGEGLDEVTRARVFEPFFTTKGHGTGLGLVITREIIESHGGVVRCEARAPRGTRFVIGLPVARREAGEDEPARSQRPHAGV